MHIVYEETKRMLRGMLPLALVTFGTWRPFRVFLGAYLFGGMTMLQMNLQSIGIFRSDSVYFHGALCGDDYRFGADFEKSDLDSSEHAGFSRKAV